MFRTLIALIFVFSFGTSVKAEESAKESGSSVNAMGLLSAGTNAAMGAALMTQCPVSTWACIGGALSLAQVPLSLMSAGSGKKVSKSFDSASSPLLDTSSYDFGDLKPVSIDGKLYTPQQMEKLIGLTPTNMEALKAQGYEVDAEAGTIKTPKGKAPISAASSGASLARAGLIDPSEIAEYDQAMKKMSNINVVSMPGAGGGGGSRQPSSSYDENPFAFNMAGAREKAAAGKTTGLSKDFGGDPIGVSTDNIFDMVHRNYQKKVQSKMFVE